MALVAGRKRARSLRSTRSSSSRSSRSGSWAMITISSTSASSNASISSVTGTASSSVTPLSAKRSRNFSIASGVGSTLPSASIASSPVTTLSTRSKPLATRRVNAASSIACTESDPDLDMTNVAVIDRTRGGAGFINRVDFGFGQPCQEVVHRFHIEIERTFLFA